MTAAVKKGKVAPVFKAGDKVTVKDGVVRRDRWVWCSVVNDNDRVTLFLALAHHAESVLKIQLQSRALSAPALR
jgi:hypothetical protein